MLTLGLHLIYGFIERFITCSAGHKLQRLCECSWDRASGIINQENEKSLRYRREEIGFNSAARPTTAGDIHGWLGHVGCVEEAVWERDLGQGGAYLH